MERAGDGGIGLTVARMACRTDGQARSGLVHHGLVYRPLARVAV